MLRSDDTLMERMADGLDTVSITFLIIVTLSLSSSLLMVSTT